MKKRVNLIARIWACARSQISKKSVLPLKIVRSVVDTQLRMRTHAEEKSLEKNNIKQKWRHDVRSVCAIKIVNYFIKLCTLKIHLIVIMGS